MVQSYCCPPLQPPTPNHQQHHDVLHILYDPSPSSSSATMPTSLSHVFPLHMLFVIVRVGLLLVCLYYFLLTFLAQFNLQTNFLLFRRSAKGNSFTNILYTTASTSCVVWCFSFAFVLCIILMKTCISFKFNTFLNNSPTHFKLWSIPS